MSTLSDAVSLDRISRVVGYKITKGNFAESTPNLPQRIAVLAEANTDKQSALPSIPFQPLSLQDVADKFGYGSPAYLTMRILRPLTGGGVGQPIVFYPVAEPAAGTAGVSTITVSGTATKIGVHKVYVAGRNNVDGQPFEISIAVGDTASVVAGKIIAAVNKVYGSPVVATGSSANAVLTTKWKSISAALKVRVSTEGDSAGLSYSIVTTVGTGSPILTTALSSFENDWNTIVINPYGADSTVLDTLQTFNGKPDPINPTGRYQGIIFKPFVALFSQSSNDPVTDVVVSGRSTDCTNVYCPAPNCDLFPVEVAANVAAVLAPIMQNSPHVDVNGQAYPDATLNTSVSGGIGKYASYDYRDQAVKAGLSTVDFVGGAFQIQDLVTTYNPTGEITPQYRYVRNLVGIDWNVRYAYLLLENAFVVNKTLIPDGQIVGASNTIKPSEWKAILYGMFDDLANRGIIADAQFSKDSLKVQISSTNPDRFETFFRYKRTGIARICSTTAEAGFYYGS